MQAKVLHAVQSGTVDATNADQITWLPQTWWRDRMY